MKIKTAIRNAINNSNRHELEKNRKNHIYIYDFFKFFAIHLR